LFLRKSDSVAGRQKQHPACKNSAHAVSKFLFVDLCCDLCLSECLGNEVKESPKQPTAKSA